MEVRDVSGALGCIGIWGPRVREVLAPVAETELSDEAFPYMRAREIVVGEIPCVALRTTYVGELGWELYPRTELSARLLDLLLEAGAPHHVVPAGYRAIDSLRLEKGYRAWSSDITPEDHLFEAGLGPRHGLKEGDFIGRKALEELRPEDVVRSLRCVTLHDPRAMALGNEPVFAGGRVVSRVTSGGIGYAVERSIAYAYLPPELSAPGTPLEVEVFGERVPAEVAEAPLWDPRGDRIRA